MKVSNGGLMRGMANAFEKGDVSGFSKFQTDDVTYHMPGRNLISGDYHGVEAVLALWKWQVQSLISMHRVKTYDMAATVQHIIMLAEVSV